MPAIKSRRISPCLIRLELTGFIKEVRQNKHGSLTGLSLEDIVANVSELVELKKKVTFMIVRSLTNKERTEDYTDKEELAYSTSCTGTTVYELV